MGHLAREAPGRGVGRQRPLHTATPRPALASLHSCPCHCLPSHPILCPPLSRPKSDPDQQLRLPGPSVLSPTIPVRGLWVLVDPGLAWLGQLLSSPIQSPTKRPGGLVTWDLREAPVPALTQICPGHTHGAEDSTSASPWLSSQSPSPTWTAECCLSPAPGQPACSQTCPDIVARVFFQDPPGGLAQHQPRAHLVSPSWERAEPGLEPSSGWLCPLFSSAPAHW